MGTIKQYKQANIMFESVPYVLKSPVYDGLGCHVYHNIMYILSLANKKKSV